MKFRKFVNFIAYLGIIILVVGLGLNSIPNKFGDWCKINKLSKFHISSLFYMQHYNKNTRLIASV